MRNTAMSTHDPVLLLACHNRRSRALLKHQAVGHEKKAVHKGPTTLVYPDGAARNGTMSVRAVRPLLRRRTVDAFMGDGHRTEVLNAWPLPQKIRTCRDRVSSD